MHALRSVCTSFRRIGAGEDPPSLKLRRGVRDEWATGTFEHASSDVEEGEGGDIAPRLQLKAGIFAVEIRTGGLENGLWRSRKRLWPSKKQLFVS